MKHVKAANVFIWDIWKKNIWKKNSLGTFEKKQIRKIFSKVQLFFAYKMGTFLRNGQTHKQTHKLTDGKLGLQSCMSQLKLCVFVWAGEVYEVRTCLWLIVCESEDIWLILTNPRTFFKFSLVSF